MSSYSKISQNRISAIKETIISFVSTFVNIFFIIGQDWYNLLNHCLNTQRQPHARPCGVRRAVLPFTNDVITSSFALFGYWFLDFLDKFTIKVMKIFHRSENSHQNSIGFTKFTANVREN